MELFFYLLCGHALADFPLQTDFMARGKSYKSLIPFPWVYLMTAHSLIHGGVVGLLTGDFRIGIAETIAHWLIDLAKCAGKSNIHSDQFCHVICKAAWACIALSR